MNSTEIHQCLKDSFADTPFPEIAKRLGAAGVRSYRVDLIRLRSTYYGERTETEDSSLPLSDIPAIPARFDPVMVEAAVRAIQQKQIGYAVFLRKIMGAGCAAYAVYLNGRRVDYIGRDGQTHTELFPGAKP